MGNKSHNSQFDIREGHQGSHFQSSAIALLLERPFFNMLLILSVGFLAYSNTFSIPFQWDGIPQIIQNSVIQDIRNYFPGARGYTDVANDYNPRRSIGYLTFALNYHWGGLQVTGYHVVNLLIHLTNALLVYVLVALTFRTPFFRDRLGAFSDRQSGAVSSKKAVEESSRHASSITMPAAVSLQPPPPARLIALFSALLFVSHPIQTQAVVYVIQRFASLAALFYLLSLLMYIRGRMASGQAGRLASYCMSMLFALLAMRTKETTFTLPLLIIIYEFTFFKSSLKKKLIFLLAGVLVLLILFMGLIQSGKPLGELLSDVSKQTRLQTDMSRWDYLMTEFRVIVTYIRLLFLPINQNIDYDYPISHSLFSPAVFLSFLFLVSLCGLAAYFFYTSRRTDRTNTDQTDQLAGRKTGKLEAGGPPHHAISPKSSLRFISFGIFWFFVTLSIESSVIPIADVMFEHRVYLPSVGALSAITAGVLVVAFSFRLQWIVIPVLVLAVAALSGTTYARNTVWKNNISLWEDAVKKSPDKARPHHNLGTAYSEEGRIDESIEQFNTAIALMPDYAEAYFNIGTAYTKAGRYDEALKAFQTAVSLIPDYADAHFNMSIVYSRIGNMDDAVRSMLLMVKLRPEDADAHFNLGNFYFTQGRIDEAVREFQTAITIRPNYAEAHNNLGAGYVKQGKVQEAIHEFQITVNLNPDAVEARNNLQNLSRAAGQNTPDKK